MGVKYLTGKGLAKRILEVMAGDNPWMCVAFLGPNWVNELFGDRGLPENLRVVCDLRMGMTVQKALRVGGAPNNKRLRHLPDQQMHAKIYASDNGAVVCSANASHAALSSEDRVEDGVWLPLKCDEYKNVKKIFEERYSKAVSVDADALVNAPEYLGASAAAAVGSGQAVVLDAPPSLLDVLRHDPEAFKGIRFVFSNEEVDEVVKEGAKTAMEEEAANIGGATKEGGAAAVKYDYFSNWDKEETDWPALFICVYQRSNGSILLGMHRHLRFFRDIPDGEDGTEEVFVTAKVRWNTSGAAFGDLRKLATVKQCETEMKDLFQNECKFDHVAGKVLDARGARKALKLT